MKKSFENARRRENSGIHYKHDLGQHFLYDEELLRSLVEATGVKADRIVMAGNHTHSAPDMNSTDGSIAKYKEFQGQRTYQFQKNKRCINRDGRKVQN